MRSWHRPTPGRDLVKPQFENIPCLTSRLAVSHKATKTAALPFVGWKSLTAIGPQSIPVPHPRGRDMFHMCKTQHQFLNITSSDRYTRRHEERERGGEREDRAQVCESGPLCDVAPKPLRRSLSPSLSSLSSRLSSRLSVSRRSHCGRCSLAIKNVPVIT